MTISTVDPIERAKMVYATEECRRNFEEDLCLHLLTPGCTVYKDENSIALLRPVHTKDSYELLTDPTYIHPAPNAWWVYLLVGDIVALTARLNYPLEFIGWERKNKPRFYKLKQLKRCLHI